MQDTVYTPSAAQSAQVEILKQINAACAEKQIHYWIAGGYANDILVNQLTRDHHDVDMIVLDTDKPEFVEVLKVLGFEFMDSGEGLDETFKFVNPSNNFRVEFGTIVEENGKLKLGEYEMPKAYFPEQALGQLNGTALRCVSFEGLQRLDMIQDQQFGYASV